VDGVFSVGEIVRYLRDIMDEDALLANVWVQGEVSNLSRAGSGHTYFTLKDQDSQLRCVMFRGAGRTQAHVHPRWSAAFMQRESASIDRDGEHRKAKVHKTTKPWI